MMSEFEISLKKIKSDSKMSDLQKIKTFYDLMIKSNIEPIVMRLSGYIENKPLNVDYLITFTSTKAILLKKNKARKLIDPGYVAGLGPYLYYVLSDKVEFSDIKIKDSFISKENATTDLSNEISIDYKDIKKIVFYYDAKTLVSNMLGTAIKENVLIIHTVSDKYEFVIPTGKNGAFDKTFYWLNMCLPIRISKK